MNRQCLATGQVWLITGCSSGLGKSLAEAVLERGWDVVATARDVSSLADLQMRAPDKVKALTLDVTKPETIAGAVKAALAWKGRIDVLVNNAGYGIVGAVEEVDEAEAQAAFDANFFGVYRMIRAVLPHMRERGAGHIVNVSSMLGHTSAAGFGLYSAVKFAVEGMSEALSKEVEPFGIGVTIVAPGPFRTAFRSRGLHSAPPREPYDVSLAEFRRNLMAGDGKQPGDPRRAGDLIVDAVNAEAPPLRLILGEPALTQIRSKLAHMVAEMNEWEARSIATAFPP